MIIIKSYVSQIKCTTHRLVPIPFRISVWLKLDKKISNDNLKTKRKDKKKEKKKRFLLIITHPTGMEHNPPRPGLCPPRHPAVCATLCHFVPLCATLYHKISLSTFLLLYIGFDTLFSLNSFGS